MYRHICLIWSIAEVKLYLCTILVFKMKHNTSSYPCLQYCNFTGIHSGSWWFSKLTMAERRWNKDIWHFMISFRALQFPSISINFHLFPSFHWFSHSTWVAHNAVCCWCKSQSRPMGQWATDQGGLASNKSCRGQGWSKPVKTCQNMWTHILVYIYIYIHTYSWL